MLNLITNAMFIAFLLVTLVGFPIWMLIDSYKFDKEIKARELARQRRKQKESMFNAELRANKIYHNAIKHGFVSCDYSFGRWYINYEVNDGLTHFSVTMSFREDGTPWENYSRLNTRYGFATKQHERIFNVIKGELHNVIRKMAQVEF